jgi:hypothetical protein
MTISLIGICGLGIVFQFIITYGGSFLPCANSVDITVTFFIAEVFMDVYFAALLLGV